MSDCELKDDIKKASSKREFPFWSILVIVGSILHGWFILRFPGYLTTHSESEVGIMTEHFIGWGLIGFSITKMLGLRGTIEWIRRGSVVALSFIWTGLFTLSAFYSFGSGSPNPGWYFYGIVVLACYRVSYKGGY